MCSSDLAMQVIRAITEQGGRAEQVDLQVILDLQVIQAHQEITVLEDQAEQVVLLEGEAIRVIQETKEAVDLVVQAEEEAICLDLRLQVDRVDRVDRVKLLVIQVQLVLAQLLVIQEDLLLPQ